LGKGKSNGHSILLNAQAGEKKKKKLKKNVEENQETT